MTVPGDLGRFTVARGAIGAIFTAEIAAASPVRIYWNDCGSRLSLLFGDAASPTSTLVPIQRGAASEPCWTFADAKAAAKAFVAEVAADIAAAYAAHPEWDLADVD